LTGFPDASSPSRDGSAVLLKRREGGQLLIDQEPELLKGSDSSWGED